MAWDKEKQEPVNPWIYDAFAYFAQLIRMEEVFDEDIMNPLDNSASAAICLILSRLNQAQRELAKPSLMTRGVDGYILEWHSHGYDVEIECHSLEKINIWISKKHQDFLDEDYDFKSLDTTKLEEILALMRV